MKFFSSRVMRAQFIITAIVCFCGSNTVSASEIIPSETTMNPTTSSQTARLETTASRWSITVTEYQTYLNLMSGPLGKWNKDIDPLMALGMFANSPQEERRYAELYAQQEFELTERVLSFQRTYRSAFNMLYPTVEVLDQKLLAPYFKHQAQQTKAQELSRLARKRFRAGDRILFFADHACNTCNHTIRKLMTLITSGPNAGVDIYVLGTNDKQGVRRWAATHKINEKWLDAKKLTLNSDEGLLARLKSMSVNDSNMNVHIFLHRQGKYFLLKPKDLGL